MQTITSWFRRYRKWVLGLGGGYIALEIIAALLVALGIVAMKS